MSEDTMKHWKRTSKKLLGLLIKPAQQGLCQPPCCCWAQGLEDHKVWENGTPFFLHAQAIAQRRKESHQGLAPVYLIVTESSHDSILQDNLWGFCRAGQVALRLESAEEHSL